MPDFASSIRGFERVTGPNSLGWGSTAALGLLCAGACAAPSAGEFDPRTAEARLSLEQRWLFADGVSQSEVTVHIKDATGRSPVDGFVSTLSSTLGNVSVSPFNNGVAHGTLTAGNVWGEAILAVVGVAATTGDTRIPFERGDAYSAQLHMHGTISELSGTYTYQVLQARRFGTDVLWWTDHDFGYGQLMSVEDPGLDNGWLFVNDAQQWPVSSWATSASGGALSLALGVDASPEGFRPMVVALRADGSSDPQPAVGSVSWRLEHSGLRRSLLGLVRLRLELFVPERDVGRARIVVNLSQPVAASAPLQTLILSDPADARPSEPGELWLDIGLSPGWNTIDADISGAVALLLGSADQAVDGVAFEFEGFGAGTSRFAVAGLRLTQELCCDSLRAVHQQWLTDTFEGAPVQYAGHEISSGSPHLNVFGPEDVPFVDYTEYGLEGDAELIVADAHAAGAVVSLNHIFGIGVGTAPEAGGGEAAAARCAELGKESVYGVDLLEVGYRQRVWPMSTHLAVWDCLGRLGFLLTGIGTSDSHTNVPWDLFTNTFTTWVYASTDDRVEIAAALGAGRAFFGDPTVFADTAVVLDLRSGRDAVMGQVVTPVPESDEIRVVASPVQAGWTVKLVANGTSVASAEADGVEFDHNFAIDLDGLEAVVRAEVWAGETGLLYSNPIYYRSESTDVPSQRIARP